VQVLYVFDPGPDGSIGDVSWILDARRAGRIPLLVYQGVLMTALAREADVVLPGSSWVEKDSTFTNDQGRVQAAGRVFAAPADARDDREIFLALAKAVGAALPFASVAEVRSALADALASNPAYADLRAITFARPVSAKNWLQGSNPSERWKWDFMFQDLPPVKFDWMPMPNKKTIALQPVQSAPKPSPEPQK
jgi:NADH-quinone oxidoreductase subunit G